MADENHGGGPTQLALEIFGVLVVLFLLWYVRGGPAQGGLRGLFLNAPPPLGNGQAYGPGSSTSTSATTSQPQQNY